VRESLGLIGESAGIHALRKQIETVAHLAVPVLIRGETGSGKELVARALHLHGPRKDAPYRAVNMAAVSPTLAASELFGHAKGAFTGADRAHEGFFLDCHRGTLFLDEVGETPIAVQAMLLRTLETGVVQRVGGTKEETVDVRLITATDADLEALVRSGGFRGPLLHRLSGFELFLPPLRERRDDIGRLLYTFLREELDALGKASVLELGDARDPPWLAPETVARLCAYDWPGNVRQLRNVARQLAISNGKLDRLPAAEEPDPRPKPRARKRRPADVSDDELARALANHRWRLDDAADELGISRSSMYLLIDKSPRFRKAKDLDREELLQAHQQAGGDLQRMSELLQVSIGGLRLRMKDVLGD
jgi:two-component system nitrogen regulation response regulator GlnG